jgi:hypothetical protein
MNIDDSIKTINSLHGKVNGFLKMATKAAIEAGKTIAELKTSCRHGEFLPACERLNFKEKTRLNYTNLFHYSIEHPEVADLPLYRAYVAAGIYSDDCDEPEVDKNLILANPPRKKIEIVNSSTPVVRKPKVYLAGKIEKHCWRSQYVGGLRDYEYYDEGSSDYRQPKDCGNFTYVGPFFIGCDHGCFHGKDSHGVGVAMEGDCSIPSLGCKQTFDACVEQIRSADLFFVRIAEEDCFGTLVEVGIAHQLGKRIHIHFLSQRLADSMWFPAQCADSVCIGTPDGFDEFVSVSRMTYPEYLQTPHWIGISKRIKERDSYSCVLCNSKDRIEAHHRTYQRLGRELDTDLHTLCRKCHSKFHDKRFENV